MKNHFIIVGAQRSGTTYLYKLLDEHPEICMSHPIKPEPKYFINKKVETLDLNFYHKKYFNNCLNSSKIYGEKSTSYYEIEETPKLISSLLPKAKIIFILRNPVDRALSNYFFSLNNGLEKRTLNEVFLENRPQPKINLDNFSVNPYNYLGRGKYYKFILDYKKYFSDSNLKIIIFEDFINNSEKIKKLFSFLNVNQNFTPKDMTIKVNTSVKSNLIPAEVKNYLKNYYENSNSKLEYLFNINLNKWK